MNTGVCITFDFDGTLYPIAPYDSEQRLILEIAQHKGRIFRNRAKRFIAQDLAGRVPHGSFHSRYARMVRTVKPDMVEQAAAKVAANLPLQDREAIRRMAEHADLIILSCGTENLIRAFLKQLELEHLFSAVRAKRLEWDEHGLTHLVADIKDPQGKAEAIQELRSCYGTIVAVGDGPTDVPMLHAADLGLIITWNRSTGKRYPFTTYATLSEVADHVTDYLSNACEA